jgi:hypothetical protein
MFATSAFGQGGATTSSVTGVVVDASGAVIPGADIVARNNATAGDFRAVSNTAGEFTIPALNPGTYTVTVSLMGFKTVVLPDVQLIAAQPAKVKVTLEIGELKETVTVTGAATLVQAESATVETTLSAKQLDSVPMADHSALAAVAMLPGVNTTGAVRQSTFMGMPQSTLNLTIDGVNVQDGFFKSTDGFFTTIFARMDAVEAVTVSTADPGADSSGQGAVQVRFQTRSGTNRFQGSAYEYLRRTSFNTNYWFNAQQGLPKPAVTLDNFGFRVGGPIRKDKLFYFFNLEENRDPGSVSRTRTMLTADASNGIFRWNGGPSVGVNLYALAASNGQLATSDPIVQQLLGNLQTAAIQGTLRSTGNPITQFLNYVVPYMDRVLMPTTRIDYNVATNHRVGVSVYYQAGRTTPDVSNSYDPAFPGFPGAANRVAERWSTMGDWRWTFSPNAVSQLRFGYTYAPYDFGVGLSPDVLHEGQYSDWNSFLLSPSTSLMSSLSFSSLGRRTRSSNNRYIDETVNWQKGKHSLAFGASYTMAPLDLPITPSMGPTLPLGVDPSDPASAMFTTANFPGASATDLTNARNLYGMLTGRVTSITGNAYLDGNTGQYVYLGTERFQFSQREFGFFAQDSWKLRPNLTLSLGLRYELQLPFVAGNSLFSRPLDYCNTFGISGCAAGSLEPNLFAPGSLNGQLSQLRDLSQGQSAYNTDKDNLGPSLGLAWQPHVSSKWTAMLLGQDPVFRGGYSTSFIREGLAAFSGIYGSNPGISYSAARSMSLGNLVPASQLPLLLRNGWSQFGPGSFPSSPQYPLTPTTSNSVNEFYPDTQTPSVHSFNLGFQRTLSPNTAMEVRYVGTRLHGGWWTSSGGRNLNEYNLVENGFLSEFQLAQANLAANIAAGRGNTFAYKGPGTGTNPLPIMLAWLNGSTAASSAASYTGTAWSNSSVYGNLAKMNPSAVGLATYLQTANATYRTNAANAGLPANFFLLNPGVSGAYVMGRPEDGINSRYDALQVELRRRMSHGFLLQGSYQYVMRSQQTNFYTLRMPGEWADTAVPHHAVKVNWVYELPFGQGQKWGGGVGRLGNALIGGWSWNGIIRIQSGNVLDFGDVRLVGMTDSQLQDAFALRFQTDSNGVQHVYMLPDDIIQNTIKAFSTDPTSSTGYGALGAPSGRYLAPASGPDCINGYPGQCSGGHPLHHYVTGPSFFRADMTIAKRIDLTRRVSADLRVDVLNVFNNVDFYGTTGYGTSTSNFEVTSAFTDPSVLDPGGRLIQFVFRVNF